MSVARVAQRYLLRQQRTAREVFAALPYEVRLAHTILEILKVAYTDDNSLTLGLAMLHAYHKAGITGPIGRTGLNMEDIGPLLKSSKAFKPAMVLAKMVFQQVRVKNPEYLDNAVFETVQALHEGQLRLDSSKTLAQANLFVANNISFRVLDQIRGEKVRDRHKDVAYDLMDPGELRSKVPAEAWHAFLKEIDRNPIFKDNTGRNRMMDWIQFELGASEYKTRLELAESMGLTERAFSKTWLRHPQRQKALEKAFQVVLDRME